ncbi:putative dimethylaniline monooxygenase [Cryomyces antarcticus]
MGDYDAVIIGCGSVLHLHSLHHICCAFLTEIPGIYGIAAARTYLELHPLARLVILESEEVIGGTWSSDRVYDDFWTQTPLGMAEFSDSPLVLPRDQKTYHGFFPASYISDYLEKYLDSHHFNGQSLRDRVLFSKNVDCVTKVSDTWIITCEHTPMPFKARSLIVASGMTSEPHHPILPDKTQFKGEMLHQKRFGQSAFHDDQSVKNVTVLGGGKSAADIAYSYGKSGKSVSWIIREDGCGPSGHVRAEAKGPYESSVAMFNTRMASSFSPSIFTQRSCWSRFLHGTRLGRKMIGWIWEISDAQNRAHAGYKTRQGAGKGFELLEPDTSVFWQNDGSGIQQRPEFWDVIANKVNVYRSEITSLSDRNIVLQDGSTIPTDFFSLHESARLGLPVSVEHEDTETSQNWKQLEQLTRSSVLKRFPRLANPPSHFQHPASSTPYRLYKAIAPLDDPSVVILGHIQVGNNFAAAEVQALWATAFLDGRVALPGRREMEQEIAETYAWCRLRYLDKGQSGTFYYFDLVPYIDMLLADLGLNTHKRSWVGSILSPIQARDLQGLLEESMTKLKNE